MLNSNLRERPKNWVFGEVVSFVGCFDEGDFDGSDFVQARGLHGELHEAFHVFGATRFGQTHTHQLNSILHK